MIIKILGKESSKRDYLIAVTQTALWELGMNINIAKVEENQIIQTYGIKQTPAMMIDEKVIFEGHVPGISEIKKIISQYNS